MNVLHGIHTWLSLTAVWLYNQVRFLPDDIENHVVCRNTSDLEHFPQPNMHVYGQEDNPGDYLDRLLTKFGYGRFDSFIAKTAEVTGAKILHSHFGQNGWRHLGAARRAGVKHIVTFYGWDLGQLPMREPVWLKRYRRMFGAIDRVLCEGPHMARTVVELGCPEEKVKVHALGIELDTFRFEPRRWQPGQTLQVLIAASFREKKGIPYALKALGRIKADVPLEITIIGDATAQEHSRREKQKILEVIDSEGLAPHVTLAGFRTHAEMVESAYEHHIYMAPSVTAADGDSEGGAPVALIEMAASGMPVVSSRHCDIPGVIIDGKTGFLAEERDVDGLEQCLRQLIDHPENWDKMTTAGRKHVEEHFEARTQGRRLAEHYREVINQP